MRTFEAGFETFVLGIPRFFSNDSEDFAHTDLVTMDMEIEGSLPIQQKPYNLSLKHTTWVQKELETLEKAGLLFKVFLLWPVPLWLYQNELDLENPHTEGCVLLNNMFPLNNLKQTSEKNVALGGAQTLTSCSPGKCPNHLGHQLYMLPTVLNSPLRAYWLFVDY